MDLSSDRLRNDELLLRGYNRYSYFNIMKLGAFPSKYAMKFNT